MLDGMIVKAEYSGIPVVTALIDNRIEYLSFVRDSELSNIYVGKVENVVKNINAAFVRYDGENTGYLPLKSLGSSCVVNRSFGAGDSLRQGDEVIVQVESEAVKTKRTKLTTHIVLSGKYGVVTLGLNGVGCSMKIADDIRSRLIASVKDAFTSEYQGLSESLGGCSFGTIIRTEAASLSETDASKAIVEDVRNTVSKIAAILSQGRSRTVYSQLKADTKDEDLFEVHIKKAENFLKSRNIENYEIKEDNVVFGISSKIDELRKNKVWLKSGAFLIIEQLESFNAIDVNTGKAIQGKKDVIHKVNIEAAVEIMRQIRLRNLTGMILIDFINSRTKEDEDELIQMMNELCRQDTIHTRLVDITGLGIMELIRNKNDKSLKEIVTNC